MDEPTITPATLDVLQGDRMCVRCGYNLIGQPIRQHESLKLVAAQCPECGTFAALQEYPAFGRWAGRWATLLAGVWFIAIFIALLISSYIIFRYAESTEVKASRRFATFIDVQQQQWIADNEIDPASIISYWDDMMKQDVYFHQFLPEWRQLRDVNDLLADAGGWFAITDWSAAYAWFWMSLVAIPIGAFWSIALLHVKRRYLFIIAVLIVLVAACWYVLIPYWTNQMFVQVWIGSVAKKAVGEPFGYLTIAVAIVPLFTGLLIGRSCARLAVRLLLPPHLRSSLAFLWIAENKPPPRRAIWDQPIA